jgi:hypothetical protein
MNTNLKRVITSAVATAALLVNAALPVFATTTIEISGNGSDSTNTAEVEFSQNTTVVQSNVADVYNNVDADADTGGNDANDNTGGDVDIDTGNATVDVGVTNTLNSNTAEVDCCPQGPVEVLISGNGSDSTNLVDLDLGDEEDPMSVEVYQDNYADVTNLVWADADTGDNNANDNTGGSVSIDTGNASTWVALSTSANANSARIGGGSGTGSVSAMIVGNGSDSKNTIELELLSETLLVQSNVADVFNKVDADADTGYNDANDNTGGDVDIDTGNALVDVTVDNMVNFNWAAADCGCLLGDLLAKIAGNGTDSVNLIDATLGSETLIFQGNCAEEGGPGEWTNGHEKECELENKVDADADTGDNDAKDNTGDPGGDPSIDTGDAETDVDIENSGNSNVYGDAPEWDWELPFPGFSFNLNLSFNLSDLLEALLG